MSGKEEGEGGRCRRGKRERRKGKETNNVEVYFRFQSSSLVRREEEGKEDRQTGKKKSEWIEADWNCLSLALPSLRGWL